MGRKYTKAQYRQYSDDSFQAGPGGGTGAERVVAAALRTHAPRTPCVRTSLHWQVAWAKVKKGEHIPPTHAFRLLPSPQTLVPKPEQDEHTGLLGPVLRAAVGQV